MPEPSDSVNLILNFVRSEYAAARAAGDDERLNHLNAIGVAIGLIRDYVDEVEERLRPLPQDQGDLSDLPKELLDELQSVKVDDIEQQVIDVIRANGEPANLDTILIGLFRKFAVVQRRRYLMNKLYKMGQRGLIVPVPKKKAVYGLPEFENGNSIEEESAIGEDPDEIPF